MKHLTPRWAAQHPFVLSWLLAVLVALLLWEVLPVQRVEGLATQAVSEDFESGSWSGGSGWTAGWSRGGSSSYTSLASGSAQSGYRQALVRANASLTRPFSLSGTSKATLSYWVKSSSFESGDRASVQVSTNGTTWSTLRTHQDGEDDGRYRQVTLDLSSYTGSASIYLRFAGQMSASSDYFYVDTISITTESAGASSTPPPPQTSTPTPTPTTQAPSAPSSSAGTGDDFESGTWSGGTGWSGAWSRSGSTSYTSVASSGAQSGSRQALVRANASITRAFSLSGKSAATLSYWARAYSFESGDRAVVQVSLNGSTWTTLQTLSDGQDDNRYRQFIADISSFAGAPTVYLRIAGLMSASSDYFYVDTITVTGAGSAPAATPTPSPSATPSPTPTNPPAPTATPSPTPSTSTLQKVTSGIVVDGKLGTLIENVQISTSSGPCITVRNSENVTIRNSEIGPCGGNGIIISDSANVTVQNSYVHPEFHNGTCCDKGNGIFAFRSSGIVVQDSVVAYGESNIELLGVQSARITNNFLLNPVGPFPRGGQVQVWSHEGRRSSDIRVEGNYVLASRDPQYAYAEGQTDAINFGFVDGVVVRGNYITGGRYPSGCGLIADQEANNVQLLDNKIFETGQCGIGIAGGSNHTLRGNSIYSNGISGNVGNVAMYVWNQYSTPCGAVDVSDNTAVLIRPDGSYQYNSFWNGGGCQLTLGANVFGQKALDALSPTSTKMAPPANVWTQWIQ